MQLKAIELALGERAKVRDAKLYLAGRTVALDSKGRISCDVPALSLGEQVGIDELLSGTIPRESIEGRVVVLGHARSDTPKVKLGNRAVGVHGAFNRQVACLYGLPRLQRRNSRSIPVASRG